MNLRLGRAALVVLSLSPAAIMAQIVNETGCRHYSGENRKQAVHSRLPERMCGRAGSNGHGAAVQRLHLLDADGADR